MTFNQISEKGQWEPNAGNYVQNVIYYNYVINHIIDDIPHISSCVYLLLVFFTCFKHKSFDTYRSNCAKRKIKTPLLRHYNC